MVLPLAVGSPSSYEMQVHVEEKANLVDMCVDLELRAQYAHHDKKGYRFL